MPYKDVHDSEEKNYSDTNDYKDDDIGSASLKTLGNTFQELIE
jgi:hypothetical protein